VGAGNSQSIAHKSNYLQYAILVCGVILFCEGERDIVDLLKRDEDWMLRNWGMTIHVTSGAASRSS
jgi:hypothetical protein